MAFDANAAAKAAIEGAFEFEWGDRVYVVPGAFGLPAATLRRLVGELRGGRGKDARKKTAQDDDGLGRVFELLERIWPPDAYAALLEMPMKVVGQVTRAWLDHDDTAEDAEDVAEGKERSES